MPYQLTCAYCKMQVEENDAINIDRRLFHNQCFKCKECGMNLTTNNYCVKSNIAYCLPHGFAGFAYDLMFKSHSISHSMPDGLHSVSREDNMCRACGRYATASNSQRIGADYYHLGCFKCASCQTKLDTLSFTVVSGNLYCSACQNNLRNAPSPDDSILSNFTDELQFIPPNQGLGMSQSKISVSNRSDGPISPITPLEPKQSERPRCTVCDRLVRSDSISWFRSRPYCEQHFPYNTEKPLDNLSTNHAVSHEECLLVKAKPYRFTRSIPVDDKENDSRTVGRYGVQTYDGQSHLAENSMAVKSRSHTVGTPVVIEYVNSNDIPRSDYRSSGPFTNSGGSRSSKRRSRTQQHKQQPLTSTSSSNLQIDYQCRKCDQIIAPNELVQYGYTHYHYRCAMCDICRATPKTHELQNFRLKLYCKQHLDEQRRKTVFSGFRFD